MKERKCVYVGVFSFFLVPGIVFLVFLFFISRFVFLFKTYLDLNSSNF